MTNFLTPISFIYTLYIIASFFTILNIFKCCSIPDPAGCVFSLMFIAFLSKFLHSVTLSLYYLYPFFKFWFYIDFHHFIC